MTWNTAYKFSGNPSRSPTVLPVIRKPEALSVAALLQIPSQRAVTACCEK